MLPRLGYQSAAGRGTEIFMKKRFFAAALLIALLLGIASGLVSCRSYGERFEIKANQVDSDTYYLSLVSTTLGIHNADSFYTWRVSDEKVAEISSTGLLKFKMPGYVIVYATSEFNLDFVAEKVFFSPYPSYYAPIETYITDDSTEKDYTGQRHKAFIEHLNEDLLAREADYRVAEYGAESSAASAEFISALISASLGERIYTAARRTHFVDDALCIPLTEWSAGDARVIRTEISEDEVLTFFRNAFGTDIPYGVSITELTERINSALRDGIPSDETYHFAEMGDGHKYRAMIAVDFAVGVVSSYTRNSVEFSEADGASIAELLSLYAEVSETLEISNVVNLRVIVEEEAFD